MSDRTDRERSTDLALQVVNLAIKAERLAAGQARLQADVCDVQADIAEARRDHRSRLDRLEGKMDQVIDEQRRMADIMTANNTELNRKFEIIMTMLKRGSAE